MFSLERSSLEHWSHIVPIVFQLRGDVIHDFDMCFVGFSNVGYDRLLFIFVEGSGGGRGLSVFEEFWADVVLVRSYTKFPTLVTATVVPPIALAVVMTFAFLAGLSLIIWL